MPLIDETKFKEMFNVSIKIKSAQIARHIGAASRRLEQWVGATNYASGDTAIKADLELAEGFLTMHFAIAGFNTQITPDGVVKSAQSEGNTVLSYMNPDETQKLAQQFLDQAEEVARKYMSRDGTPIP